MQPSRTRARISGFGNVTCVNCSLWKKSDNECSAHRDHTKCYSPGKKLSETLAAPGTVSSSVVDECPVTNVQGSTSDSFREDYQTCCNSTGTGARRTMIGFQSYLPKTDVDRISTQDLRTHLKSALKASNYEGFTPDPRGQSVSKHGHVPKQTIELENNRSKEFESKSEIDQEHTQFGRALSLFTINFKKESDSFRVGTHGVLGTLNMDKDNFSAEKDVANIANDKPDDIANDGSSQTALSKPEQSTQKSRMLPAVQNPKQISPEQMQRGRELQQKLRDFKAGKNLNSLKTFLKTLPTRQPGTADGRNSVDSAFYDNSREASLTDESRPQLSQPMPTMDEMSSGRARRDSVSSVGSVGLGKVSPVSRRWVVAVDAVRDRRQRTADNTRKKLAELDQLKKTAEDYQVRTHRLEAELEPLREKVKRYEGVIDNLEERLEHCKSELRDKESEKQTHVDKLEQSHRIALDRENRKMEDVNMQLKDEVRRGQSEIKQLKRQVDEMTEELELLKEKEKMDEENHPKTKQLSSMRKELMQVRQVLEDSENERLSERKEKLSAIQNMIKLTKQKADMEEELDERKKADTKESSDKYMKLSAKLAVTEMKLQKLRQEKGQEIEDLQRNYLDEIRNLKKSQSKELSAITQERDELKKRIHTQIPTSSQDGRSNRVHVFGEMEQAQPDEIITFLQSEGLEPGKYSADDAIRLLYDQRRRQAAKAKELEEMLSKSKNGDLRPVVEELKEERRTAKRKMEELHEAVAAKDSEMKVTEMALRRQIEDLLAEKKGAFLQMQQAMDLAENAKDEADKCKADLDNVRNILQKRQTEMSMLQDNLLGVTSEMKTVDADLGKTRKDLSVKEAELARLKRDVDLESGRVLQEKEANLRLRTEIDQKKIIIKGCEKTIHELEDKVHVLNGTVESLKLQTTRLNSERDKMAEELQIHRNDVVGHQIKAKESDDAVLGLRTQIKSLEQNLKEKIDRLSSVSLEFEKTRTELLASQHLLSEEQDKNQSLEDEIDALTDDVKHKTEETERLQDKVSDLENELRNIKDELSQTQVSFADTEDTLKSQFSTRTLVEKELRQLQGQYKDLTREKQNLQNAFEDTKSQLQNMSSLKKQLQEDLQDAKWKLNEKILALDEIKSLKSEGEENIRSLKKDLQAADAKFDTLKQDHQSKVEENERLKTRVNEMMSTNAQLTEQLKRKKEEGDKQSKYTSHRIDVLTQQNEELRNQIRSAQGVLQEIPDLDSFDGDETDSGISTNNYIAASISSLVEKLKHAEKTIRAKQLELCQLQVKNEALNTEINRLSDLHGKEKSSLKHEQERTTREAHDRLETVQQKLEQEIQAYEKKLRDQELKTKEVQNNCSRLKHESEVLIAEQQRLQKDVRTLEDSKRSLQGQVSRLESDARKAKQNEYLLQDQLQEESKVSKEMLIKSQEECARLKAQIDQKNDLISQMECEKSNIVSQVESTTKSHDEERKRLADHLKEKDRELTELSGKLTIAQDDYQNLQREHNSIRLTFETNVDELKRNLREKERISTEAKRKLHDKERSFAEVQNKIGRLESDLQATKEQKSSLEQEVLMRNEKQHEDASNLRQKVFALEEKNRLLQDSLNRSKVESVDQSQIATTRPDLTEVNGLTKQVEKEKREKKEALRCVKALVQDNEMLARCVSGLQETISQQRNEVTEATTHLRDVLQKYDHQREISIANQRTWETLMEERSRNEDVVITRLKNENDSLRSDLGEMRREKEKVNFQLEEKSRELERTRGELDYTQKLASSQFMNKRNDNFLESQLAVLATDRSMLTKRIYALEMSNQTLQTKLLETQTWYGNLGSNMIQPKPTLPLSLRNLRENQTKHEQFLQNQFEMLASKMRNESPSRITTP